MSGSRKRIPTEVAEVRQGVRQDDAAQVGPRCAHLPTSEDQLKSACSASASADARACRCLTAQAHRVQSNDAGAARGVVTNLHGCMLSI